MPYKDPVKRRAYAVARQKKYLAAHPEIAKRRKREWYLRSYSRRKDKIREFAKNWRLNNPEKMKSVRLDWHYANHGKVLEWKRILRKKHQEKRNNAAPRPKPDRCEICKTFGPIVYDHDHVSGKFRTWACHRCNRVMGAVQDDPQILRSIADHLERFFKELVDG